MKSGNGFIIVQYDYGHLRKKNVSGLEIEIAREVNMNLREGNDQKAKVISSQIGDSWIKEGDIVWTHYLASDKGSQFEYDGKKLNRIRESQIFFKLDEDGNIKELAKGVYLCKVVVTEADKTESGIYLTPFTEKKEPLKLDVVYASENEYGISVGDRIMVKDDNHYTIDFNGEELVKMDDAFILAKYE